MCQNLSQRRDKLLLDCLQEGQRDVKYSLDDTVVKNSVPRGFCVHLVSSELCVGHWMVFCSLPRDSCGYRTGGAWLEEAS